MSPYAERMIFRSSELERYKIARQVVDGLPFEFEGEELRCHEVARLVHQAIQSARHTSRVVDGKYGPVDHSWLVLEPGTILDPYAVGRLPAVQLVDTWLTLGILYKPGDARDDIRTEVIQALTI